MQRHQQWRAAALVALGRRASAAGGGMAGYGRHSRRAAAPSRLLERDREAGEPGGSCMRNSGEVCRSQASEGAVCSQGGGQRGCREAVGGREHGRRGRGRFAMRSWACSQRGEHCMHAHSPARDGLGAVLLPAARHMAPATRLPAEAARERAWAAAAWAPAVGAAWCCPVCSSPGGCSLACRCLGCAQQQARPGLRSGGVQQAAGSGGGCGAGWRATETPWRSPPSLPRLAPPSWPASSPA